jgi:hypothetical protein
MQSSATTHSPSPKRSSNSAEDDRMIAAETQRFMAERAGATVVSKPVDHTPLISAPQDVAEIILQAAASTSEIRRKSQIRG